MQVQTEVERILACWKIMISFLRPTESEIQSYLGVLDQATTYAEEGATSGELPKKGYVLDQDTVVLGKGRSIFNVAAKAIANWKMYPFAMLDLIRNNPSDSVDEGEVCASLYRYGPCWFVNPCRVVYVEQSAHLFAFAYGTIADHVECGEERFEVRWNPDTDEVVYEIRVFSRPGHWLTWLGYPLVRREQKRFRVESIKALKAFLKEVC